MIRAALLFEEARCEERRRRFVLLGGSVPVGREPTDLEVYNYLRDRNGVQRWGPPNSSGEPLTPAELEDQYRFTNLGCPKENVKS